MCESVGLICVCVMDFGDGDPAGGGLLLRKKGSDSSLSLCAFLGTPGVFFRTRTRFGVKPGK